jgi:hypothetical protein
VVVFLIPSLEFTFMLLDADVFELLSMESDAFAQSTSFARNNPTQHCYANSVSWVKHVLARIFVTRLKCPLSPRFIATISVYSLGTSLVLF